VVTAAAGEPWCGHRDAGSLRTAWSQASIDGGWARPRDWWTSEVDAVAEALVADGDALEAVALLGRARADAGVGVRETLDDLCALYRVLPAGIPPLTALRALVEAWADESVATVRAATCEDPISGLATTAYLRTRCAEVYREAERDGAAPGDARVLLILDVAALAGATGWESLLFRLALGDCLRSVFSGGETLASAGRSTVLGLVERDRRLPHRIRALRSRLGEVAGLSGVRIWTEALPPTLPAAFELLESIDRLV
jgi:hypothetical protein